MDTKYCKYNDCTRLGIVAPPTFLPDGSDKPGAGGGGEVVYGHTVHVFLLGRYLIGGGLREIGQLQRMSDT